MGNTTPIRRGDCPGERNPSTAAWAHACLCCSRWAPEVALQNMGPAPGRWIWAPGAGSDAGVSVFSCPDMRPVLHPAGERIDDGHGPSSAGVNPAAIPSVPDGVTDRFRRLLLWLVVAMVLVGLLVAAALHPAVAAGAVVADPVPAAASARCDWSRPGADPYRGAMAAAVDRYADIPADVRAVLRSMLTHGWGGDEVLIGRDAIVDGITPGRYVGLRDMHWGDGRVCRGEVDRSGWTAGRLERAMVYTVGGYSLIVPDSCRNVARVTDTLALPPALSGQALRAARAAARASGVDPAGAVAADGVRRPQAVARAAPAPMPEPPGVALVALALAAALAAARRGSARAR